MLTTWLDYQRATLLWKCEGLDGPALARQGVPPSTLTLLGLVRHMAIVEWWWFDHIFAAGSSPEPISTEEDRDADFNGIEPPGPWRSTVPACDVSRAIVADAETSTASALAGRSVSLRWIMIHMIEEYARHNGHRPAARADRRRRGGVSAPEPGGRSSAPGVKFSVRQILASAGGAVIAAVIASTFGVKGTIIGVAIGSAAATFATALVAQSIERGQQAVKQVVVRAPDSSTLLRKLGSTVATGEAESAGETSSPSTTLGEETDRLEISAAEGGALAGTAPGGGTPATERIEATTLPMQPAGPTRDGRPGIPRSFSWQTIAGTAAIVFVIALMFITGNRADLGAAALRHLRQPRHRDQRATHLHAVAVAVADHDDDAGTDVDDLDDLDGHVHDHVDDHVADGDEHDNHEAAGRDIDDHERHQPADHDHHDASRAGRRRRQQVEAAVRSGATSP